MLLVALVAAVAVAVAMTGKDASSAPEWPDDGRMEAWPLPTDPAPLVEEAGLDLGPMGTAEHYHPQLRVLVDATPVVVPAGIGIDPETGAMSGLHTHTQDGELHVEADRKGQRFTLGQLFTQWDVALSSSRIGEYDGEVSVTVNGDPYPGDPADLVLRPDQVIELRVET